MLSYTDKKTLLIFACLLLHQFLVLIYSTHQGINRHKLTSTSEAYFHCQRLGMNNAFTDNCNHSNIESHSSSYIAIVVYIIGPLVPISVLAFAVHVQHLRNACTREENGERYAPPPPPSTTAQRLHLSQSYILTPREMDISGTIMEVDEEEEEEENM